MKVVVLERDTSSVPYQVIRATGYIAAVFSVVVCVLMIANNVSVKRLDPVHSPALTNLVTQLKSSPRDPALREEIRELDYLTRKAFFTSQHFNRIATLLLVGGLAVTIISFKTLHAYRPAPPYPNARDPKDDPATDALWARKSVTVVGLVLVGFALALALPWRSPLDTPTPTPVAPSQVASVALPATATAIAFPPLEERERQWPGFLGAASGRSRGAEVPTAWDVVSGAGIRWKAEVPLPGMNSPIVWRDRVFLSGANESSREVYCFNAITGDLLWKRAVPPAPGTPVAPPKVSEDTGFAASTMATDGSHVFAIFANGDLAAFAFDGEAVWQRSLGLTGNSYGYSSSLATFEDLVIVQFDRKQDSFIAAIEGATGKTRWQTARALGPSWASPQLIPAPQGPQLVTAANPDIVAYDPRNGQELWRVECLKGAEVAVSPAYADGVLYASAEFINLTAIKVATHQILWQSPEAVPSIGTPLVVNGLMFFGRAETGIVCLDAKTGAERWQAETDEGIYASPVLVGDRIYLPDRGGTMHIFKADGENFQPIGAPKVGEEVYSTPAVVGDGLFVRGVKHLFRFGHE